MRLRAEYSVGADLKFLGNLDMMHLMERSLRRAGIPYLLTEGFNPHIKLSMGTVLPVGVWGEKEYFDLELEDMQLEEFMERMNQEFPEAMKINQCKRIADKAPALMKIINAADYAFIVSNTDINLQHLADNILREDTLIVESHGKKKGAKDIRPGLYSILVQQEGDRSVLTFRVSINEPLNVRYDELLALLEQYGVKKELIVDFLRCGNYIKDNKNFYFPLEKVK